MGMSCWQFEHLNLHPQEDPIGEGLRSPLRPRYLPLRGGLPRQGGPMQTRWIGWALVVLAVAAAVIAACGNGASEAEVARAAAALQASEEAALAARVDADAALADAEAARAEAETALADTEAARAEANAARAEADAARVDALLAAEDAERLLAGALLLNNIDKGEFCEGFNALVSVIGAYGESWATGVDASRIELKQETSAALLAASLLFSDSANDPLNHGLDELFQTLHEAAERERGWLEIDADIARTISQATDVLWSYVSDDCRGYY